MSPRKPKREPIQCLNCQRFGHERCNCLAIAPRCAKCAGVHSTDTCTNDRSTFRCTNCWGQHPSFDRDCPSFWEKCQQIDSKCPENQLAFYPTDDQWTWVAFDQANQNETTTPTPPPPLRPLSSPQPIHRCQQRPPRTIRQPEIPSQQSFPMNRDPSSQLRIWQQNLNKSLISQLHLINSARPVDWDILIQQEPWMGHLGTRSSHNWRVLYPKAFFTDNTKTPHSLIFINSNISTNTYEQLHFESPDVTGIKISQGNVKILIINIYNNCKNNDSIDAVSSFLTYHYPDDHIPDNTHVILAGDFNRHHAWWEEERNAHLTSSEAALKPLLDTVNRFNLRMALPPNRPTLRALSTGNWTRPDNVWCSSHSLDLFINCDTNPGLQGPNTDHVPILSKLDIPLTRSISKPSRNFRAVN